MIFKILLSRSVQTPNSDKNWQISCPLQTLVCNISRHLEFIIEQGHRVSWVSGSLDSRVTGSKNVTQFHVCCAAVLQSSSARDGLAPKSKEPCIRPAQEETILWAGGGSSLEMKSGSVQRWVQLVVSDDAAFC